MKAVGFLQNAWSPMYAGDVWPRRSWLRALWACHSGRRLKKLEGLCANLEVWWDNTTPIVGADPNSVVPPDPAHIKLVLSEQDPEVVILCGKQAARSVLPLCSVPALILPHPAARTTTNALYELAGKLLVAGLTETVELKQLPGSVQEIRRAA